MVALDGDPLDVLAADRGRLHVQDEVDEGGDVVDELGGLEAHLADHRVHVAAGVGAELDLAGLVLADDLGHVRRDGAGPRRGHQAAGAQHLAQRADDAHHVRGGDAHVEVGPAALDLLGQLGPAHLVRPGGLGLVDLVALGEHDHPQLLPMPCGSTIEPRTNWSACFGSMPSRMTISTVWSNFVVLKVFSSAHRLGQRQRASCREPWPPWPSCVWIVSACLPRSVVQSATAVASYRFFNANRKRNGDQLPSARPLQIPNL